MIPVNDQYSADSWKKTNANFVRVFLPSNLELDRAPAKWRAYVAWVVYKLYITRHIDKRYQAGEYIPLNAATLRTILPPAEYRAILNWMLANGLIECNDIYKAGDATTRGYSTGYRLTSKYSEADFKQHFLCQPELANRLARYRARKEDNFLPIHHHFKSMLNGLEVVGSWPMIYLPLALIANHDFYTVVCEQGRFHHNLANLDHNYRKNIQWKGRPLFMVDIVSSQPTFLALTLREQARQGILDAGTREITGKYSESSNKTEHKDQQQPDHQHSKHDKTNKGKRRGQGIYGDDSSHFDLNNSDLNKSQKLLNCLDGNVYEELMDLTGYERDQVKVGFYATTYGGRLDMSSRTGLAFQQLWPSCYEAILAPKPPQRRRRKLPFPSTKLEPRVRHPADGALARQMQRLESDLVLGRVCERIRIERPSECLLSIHDCLITDEPNIEHFADIMRQEFAAAYGVVPRLKISAFADE
jgi:hypothetical protein